MATPIKQSTLHTSEKLASVDNVYHWNCNLSSFMGATYKIAIYDKSDANFIPLEICVTVFYEYTLCKINYLKGNMKVNYITLFTHTIFQSNYNRERLRNLLIQIIFKVKDGTVSISFNNIAYKTEEVIFVNKSTEYRCAVIGDDVRTNGIKVTEFCTNLPLDTPIEDDDSDVYDIISRNYRCD